MMKLTLNRNARVVLEHRYLKKNELGKVVEAPEQLFRRVARNIALADVKYKHKTRVEKLLKKHNKAANEFWWLATRTKELSFAERDKDIKRTEEDFYELMASLDFLPNSPTLFNAGQKLQQLAGCFVLPVEDNLNSIFKTLWMTALVHQSGGGTGFSFRKLRPRGDTVQSTFGTASGPVSFIKVYDAATEQIRQGGKRRGANMAVLPIDHPDIEEFISVKSQEGALRNFNVSVAVTDRFMQAVEKGISYNLVNPRTGKIVKREDAHRIFWLLCEAAWKNADPGVIFIDIMNIHNPTLRLGRFECTNPCGEIPLLPYEACNLGSINLAQMVKGDGVDYERLQRRVRQAVHFLDNVIDMCNYGFTEISEAAHGNRKIGLGVMGFADMLFQLRIRYASDKAVQVATEVMKFINDEARKASAELAAVRGVFPNWSKSVYVKKKEKLRNATRTAIAPTGSLSIIAGCNGGIEPVFALAFKHNVLDNEELTEINRYLIEAAKREGVYSDKLLQKVQEQGTLKGTFIPAWMKRVFVTATEIQAEWHIKMQAAFQSNCDNAVSKTVNLPEEATVDDVSNAYKLAYQLKCKGITVYRNGSKRNQVLVFGTKHEELMKKETCPKCGGEAVRHEGCITCKSCGWGMCTI